MNKFVLCSLVWLGACGGKAVPTTTSSSAPTTTMPKVAELTQGGAAWAVYLAIAAPGAPELAAAVARAKALGYEAFDKDLNCDVPVVEKPPVVGEQMLIALYFSTEAAARAVATHDGKPVVWVGEVKTMCMD